MTAAELVLHETEPASLSVPIYGVVRLLPGGGEAAPAALYFDREDADDELAERGDGHVIATWIVAP